VQCCLLGNQLVGPLVSEGHLTSDELPGLLEDSPFQITQWSGYNKKVRHLTSVGKLTEFLDPLFGLVETYKSLAPKVTGPIPTRYSLWGHMKLLIYAKMSHPVARVYWLNYGYCCQHTSKKYPFSFKTDQDVHIDCRRPFITTGVISIVCKT
jgi:hypothetical protein